QLRGLQPVRDETTGAVYPVEPLGLAQQGAEVYRANGCYACHSQQVRQTGYRFNAVLEKAGTDPDVVTRALRQANPRLIVEEAELFAMAEGEVLPLGPINLHRRGTLEKVFSDAGLEAVEAKVRFDLVPTGPDIQERGWGKRGSVAADYLYDDPAMPGSLRIGPDLSNIGDRMPDRMWHLLHLYRSRLVVEKSMMPDHRHLFEKRRVGDEPSPLALPLPEELHPGEGWEIVPKPEAIALVAYLQSLKSGQPLFEAPMAAPSN
ncbi:MAG TPA: hypothetical protein DCY13_02930, partial [Verrucomicrobiales bacterium]|nr:hypothetical protein [Verrucomicrobiales bacterium]